MTNEQYIKSLKNKELGKFLMDIVIQFSYYTCTDYKHYRKTCHKCSTCKKAVVKWLKNDREV